MLRQRSFNVGRKVMLLLVLLMSIRLMPSDEYTQFIHAKMNASIFAYF